METIRHADAILKEIHQTRQKLLDEHGGIAGLAGFLRKQELLNPAVPSAAPGDNQGNPPATENPPPQQ